MRVVFCDDFALTVCGYVVLENTREIALHRVQTKFPLKIVDKLGSTFAYQDLKVWICRQKGMKLVAVSVRERQSDGGMSPNNHIE
jgi:hypothetical protein